MGLKSRWFWWALAVLLGTTFIIGGALGMAGAVSTNLRGADAPTSRRAVASGRRVGASARSTAHLAATV